MPSKYSRKSRDRRGGHEPSPIKVPSENYEAYTPSPVQRAEFKKVNRKVARRQSKKAVEQELAWEDLADQREEAEEAKTDAWLDSIDLADPFEDYFDYLQDQEDRLQDIHDDWFPNYDHNPYGSTYSRRQADRLTAKARQYSYLAAGTLVTEADVGKTVYEVLEEAYQRSYEDRYEARYWASPQP